MRILYVAMAYDYGKKEQGPSFEDANFRSALEGMGHELIQFDFMTLEQQLGRREMNRRLIETAAAEQPDVIFFFLFEDQIEAETIRRAGVEGNAPTVNWFADDHWRFDRFTSRYAPALDWSVTTDRESLAKYAAIGCENVILSQWACNRYAYDRVDPELRYDVTFVGQAYGDRPATVEKIRAAGFEVECWGGGWLNGRVSQEEMVRVFSSSRINLNLSAAFQPPRGIRTRLRELILREEKPQPRRSQIKGRTFEVPGSGGFLLTDDVPHLGDYLAPGEEIGIFTDEASLIEQVGYWLSHEQERAAVAEAGYRRVREEHTYDSRFAEIFGRMGVQAPIGQAEDPGLDSPIR